MNSFDNFRKLLNNLFPLFALTIEALTSNATLSEIQASNTSEGIVGCAQITLTIVITIC